MEGPTSSWGSMNRLICLTLQEHDDDDDDGIVAYIDPLSVISKYRLRGKGCTW